MHLSNFLLFPLTITIPFTLAKPQPKNSILLSKIQSLTLRANRKTTSRRVAPIPQLTCVGGSARSLYSIEVLRCENSGSEYDADDVQWTCKASLPEEFKLGATDVICEGYDGPDDPYVLKGSCGVEYTLVLTEAGEAKYGRREDYEDGQSQQSTASEKMMFGLCVLFIVGVVAYGIWNSYTYGANPQPRRGRGGGGPGWGGWGGDDDNDPPPPYDPHPPRYKSNQGSTNSNWRPGFWSGTAAGAAAGYMAGNRNSTRRADPMVGSSRSAQNQRSGSGFSSSPSPSSSRYESTGFGGTQRR